MTIARTLGLFVPALLGSVATLAPVAVAGCGGSSTTGDNGNKDSGVAMQPVDSGPGTTPDSGTTAFDSGMPAMVDSGMPAPSNLVTIPLYACQANSYSFTGDIGAQKFDMIFDTGSTTLGVAGSGCSSCGVMPEYTPGATAKDQGMMAQSQYGTGSWTGEIYTDGVALGPSATTQVRFADIQSQSGFFDPLQCDGSQVAGMEGIVGFGPPGAAVQGTNGFFDDYVSQTGIANVFAASLCDSGGTLWLGGWDPSAISAAPQYTPMSSGIVSTLYYSVFLASLGVGGTTVPVSTGQYQYSIVDSGTSLFILNNAAYNALTAALNANTAFTNVFGTQFFVAAGAQAPNCTALPLTKTQLDSMLPPLEFTLGSGSTAITMKANPTESYLMPYGGNQWCAGVLAVDMAPLASIMGAALLRSNVVIWDRGHSQIGFAPHASSCD
jgi:hypothetical protein